ncbi:hypothetical protein O6H91_16G016400 [Diphasiastrum complanatum]|uniref:Uncharacterized protein n=1 Tax=Diphasiastrum complanatum TaxID=34168 RepID=A0ACC2BAA3_DIPCM|nr:hypothetical protein O6H91_16G016400 [Diphasiastrum complanatum]
MISWSPAWTYVMWCWMIEDGLCSSAYQEKDYMSRFKLDDMHLMDVYLLSRKGPIPLIDHDRAKNFDKGLLDFDSDTWTHYLPRSEWSKDTQSNRPVRGSAEKSEYFMIFLIFALCLEGGGIVLDLLVGVGTSILAVRKAGVHLFGMDIDETCVAWLKENRSTTLDQQQIIVRTILSSICFANISNI